MRTISESRARYAEVLDAVVGDREEIVITRNGRQTAVIVALEEYNSFKGDRVSLAFSGKRTKNP